MKFLFALFVTISTASAGTIVCKKKTPQGLYKVTVTDTKVTVDFPTYSKPRVFPNLKQANGLITDAGLAVFAQNHYGCIRNVVVITDAREPFNAGYMNTFEFGTCSGGQTPDSICKPDGI